MNEAPPSRTPNDLSLLLSPAWRTLAGVPVAAHVVAQLHELVSRVGLALNRALGVSAEVVPTEASPPDARWAYRCVFADHALGDVVLDFDVSACHALIQSLVPHTLPLESSGLLDSDKGLFEWVVLQCIDDLCSRQGRAPSWTLRQFLDADQEPPGGRLVPFTISVGARAGAARAVLAAESLATAAAPGLEPRVDSRLAGREVELELCLTPVPIADEERARLVPGSVLLLGCRALDASELVLRVRTGSGWDLCHARLDVLAPNLVTARCGELSPRPADRELGACTYPVLGAARLRMDQVVGWRDGLSIGFARSVDVRLRDETGREIATGELLDAGGELGVRIQ